MTQHVMSPLISHGACLLIGYDTLILSHWEVHKELRKVQPMCHHPGGNPGNWQSDQPPEGHSSPHSFRQGRTFIPKSSTIVRAWISACMFKGSCIAWWNGMHRNSLLKLPKVSSYAERCSAGFVPSLSLVMTCMGLAMCNNHCWVDVRPPEKHTSTQDPWLLQWCEWLPCLHSWDFSTELRRCSGLPVHLPAGQKASFVCRYL